MTRLPDLSEYQLHRTAEVAQFEGVPVPGLSAAFYRRQFGERVASVGRYWYHGEEVLLAWGFVDEEHCRFSAVHTVEGWQEPKSGCPPVRLIRDGSQVTGFEIEA